MPLLLTLPPNPPPSSNVLGPQEQRAGSGGGGSGGGLEQCPLCNATFADAALLVSHVEYAHSGDVDAARAQGGAVQNGGSNCSIS